MVAALVVLARRVKPLDRRASIAIHAALGTQILLGIATVMSGVALAARRAPPGGRRAARRRDRVGRACRRAAARHDRRHRLRRLSPTPTRRCASAAPIVEERLAACFNVLGPCTLDLPLGGRGRAGRRNPGAVQDHASTSADALIARIAELHSYDVPAIVVWPIDRLLGDLRRLGRIRGPVTLYPSAKPRFCLTYPPPSALARPAALP